LLDNFDNGVGTSQFIEGRTDLFGECVRLDTDGGVAGQNGTFATGTVIFDAEPVGQNLSAISRINLTPLSEFGAGAELAEGLGLAAKNFLIRTTTTTYHFWFRVDFEEIDPNTSPNSNIVDILSFFSREQVRDFLAAAILSAGVFTATGIGTDIIEVSNIIPGPVEPPPHIFMGTPPADPIEFIEVQEGQTPTIPDELPALRVQTENPHLLTEGDAIYISFKKKFCVTPGVYTAGGDDGCSSCGGGTTRGIDVGDVNEEEGYFAPDNNVGNNKGRNFAGIFPIPISNYRGDGITAFFTIDDPAFQWQFEFNLNGLTSTLVIMSSELPGVWPQSLTNMTINGASVTLETNGTTTFSTFSNTTNGGIAIIFAVVGLHNVGSSLICSAMAFAISF